MPLLENHNNALSDRYRQLASQLAGTDSMVAEKRSSLSTLFSLQKKR
jgi:hypothetical protein